MSGEDGRAGGSGDRPHNNRDDYGVIGVTDDGDEVRNQVDRKCQTAEKERQFDADSAGHRRVGGQSLEQPNQVWQQPRSVLNADVVRFDDP